MGEPLTAETLTRVRDLREMGAGWNKVVDLTGIPRVVLKDALHAAIWPPVVTRVEADGTAITVRTI